MKRILLGLALVLWAVQPSHAAELTGTLKHIKETGRIVIGHRIESRPFSFVDDQGKPVGYSIDLCKRIAENVQKTLGLDSLDVRYIPMTAQDRFQSVVDGAIDIECANSTQTLTRRKAVDFSLMTFITGGSLLTKADAQINGIADLGGKSVAVIKDTTTQTTLSELLKNGTIDATIVLVEDHDDGLAKLTEGAVDAYAGDQLVLIGLARQAPNRSDLRLAPELFSYEPYGLMVRRDDAQFRLVVDSTIAELYRSREIAAIYDKWFGDWGGRPSRLLLAMFALNSLPE